MNKKCLPRERTVCQLVGHVKASFIVFAMLAFSPLCQRVACIGRIENSCQAELGHLVSTEDKDSFRALEQREIQRTHDLMGDIAPCW